MSEPDERALDVLARVVLQVAEQDRPGWTVQVRQWPDGPAVVPPYSVDRTEVTVGGADQRVPVVPPGRLPPPGAPHHALCAGDRDRLADLLDRLASRSTEPEDVTVYGRWLFECLLAPAWPAIRALPGVAAGEGVELALEWRVGATDLHRLVWEAMHDGNAPLAGHRDLLVAITRLVPVPGTPPATITRTPRVLFAAGSALTDEVIRPGAMVMGLLRAFDAEGICASRVVQEVTIDGLADECDAFRPDLVHLVAHGTIDEDGRGLLHLGERSGAGGPAGAAALGTALTAGGRPLTAVLSACQTGVASGPAGAAPLAAQLVAGGIPIVSAMAGEVSEQACRLYTRRFVQAVHDGEPVVAAAAKGRRAALLRSESPADQLDWAMPALFLDRSVQPTFRALDPTPARALTEIADELKLRQRPLFIGRQEILQLVEDFFVASPSRRLGFVAAVREGPIGGLGGTRLLREIGFRLLRAGHVPLLLGPHGGRAPADLRAVLVEIVERAVKVAELLRLPPPPPTVLGADPGFPDAGRVAAAALAELPVDEAYAAVLETLSAFGQRSEPVRPELAGGRLGRDLGRLAAAAATAGDPFGPHTRVVVLADDVHAWVGALDPLLAMIGRNGLGNAERPVPVVATASLVQESGPALRAFRDERAGMPGYAFPELGALAPPEATLGFQWVLLHPWRRDAGPEYRKVYTAARATPPEDIHRALSLLQGVPTEVVGRLYFAAQLLLQFKQFVDGDDNQAYADYLGRYG